MYIKDCEPWLTPREDEVLMLLPSGKTNILIGDEPGITAGTVKIHIGQPYANLRHHRG